MKLFSMIFGGVGAILLLIGGFLYFREVSFLKTAEQVTGRVTDLYYSEDSDNNGGSYCPSVTFKTRSGQEVSYDSNVCSDPPAYQVGQQVKIYYDPQKPQNAQLTGLWGQYAAVLILFLIGVPFSLIGVWTFFRS